MFPRTGVLSAGTRRETMVTGRKMWWWAGGAAVVAIALMSGLGVWATSPALKVSKQEFRSEHQIGFTLQPVLPHPNVNFEKVRSPAVFPQVAHFSECLYLA